MTHIPCFWNSEKNTGDSGFQECHQEETDMQINSISNRRSRAGAFRIYGKVLALFLGPEELPPKIKSMAKDFKAMAEFLK